MIFKHPRTIAFLLSIVFVSILLEIMCRVMMYKKFPKGYYYLDPKSSLLSAVPNYDGFHHTEYGLIYMRTNRYGFRGEPLNKFKPGVKRILILGDSFVQAAQVNYEETFGSLLQASMSGAQVMQVGIPGWGQGDQLRWLKTYYEEFQPHLVIVAVFFKNDLLDNMKKDHLGSSGRVVTRDGDLLAGRNDDPVRIAKRSALTRSYAYTLIRHRLRILKRRLTIQLVDTWQKEDQLRAKRVSARDKLSVLARVRENLRIYEREPSRHLPYYSIFSKLIEEFKAFSTEMKIRLIILGIPWKEALDIRRFSAILDKFGLDLNDYDIRLPQTMAAEYIRRIGLPYLCLRDHFLKKKYPIDATGKVNPHFSLLGHVWTAEALHELILELKSDGGEKWSFT